MFKKEEKNRKSGGGREKFRTVYLSWVMEENRNENKGARQFVLSTILRNLFLSRNVPGGKGEIVFQ